MTPDQVSSWAASGESETLEFKRSTGQCREGVRTLCAMLNHRGGRVFFGVAPEGRVVGQQVSDSTLEEVAHEIQEIDPPAFPSIDRVELGGGLAVLVVTVSTGQNRPYSYRGQAYRRVGNTSPPMSRDEYNLVLLERLHGEHRWENELASGWTATDLDAAEIVRTVEEAIRRGRAEEPGTREPVELLRGLGLMRDGRVLRAATVLFGRAERLEAEYPQCLLRVARFRGTDRTEFLDNRQLHGNAFDLLLRAERFLRENLPVAGRVTPGLFERVDDPLYPPAALREALANAFCHRDYAIGGGSVGVAIYDDRLEGSRDLRRPAGSHVLGHAALRPDRRGPLRSP
jgi:ATP-dependent DNA helicase RecG